MVHKIYQKLIPTMNERTAHLTDLEIWACRRSPAAIKAETRLDLVVRGGRSDTVITTAARNYVKAWDSVIPPEVIHENDSASY